MNFGAQKPWEFLKEKKTCFFLFFLSVTSYLCWKFYDWGKKFCEGKYFFLDKFFMDFQNLEFPFFFNWIIFSFVISIKSEGREREREKVPLRRQQKPGTAFWIVNDFTCFVNFGPFKLWHGRLVFTCVLPFFFTLTRKLLLIWNFKRIFHTCDGLKKLQLRASFDFSLNLESNIHEITLVEIVPLLILVSKWTCVDFCDG